jgi:RNA polymerase primary sigma factor
MKMHSRHVSVDAPLIEGENSSMLDVMINGDEPDTDNDLMHESLGQEIARSLSTLSEKERDVVNLYYGIGQGHSWTLDEIGIKFGLTRERVRQIKEKAIRRLKHNSRSKLLKTYLGK